MTKQLFHHIPELRLVRINKVNTSHCGHWISAKNVADLSQDIQESCMAAATEQNQPLFSLEHKGLIVLIWVGHPTFALLHLVCGAAALRFSSGGDGATSPYAGHHLQWLSP
jgi:hypothetical protein